MASAEPSPNSNSSNCPHQKKLRHQVWRSFHDITPIEEHIEMLTPHVTGLMFANCITAICLAGVIGAVGIAKNQI